MKPCSVYVEGFPNVMGPFHKEYPILVYVERPLFGLSRAAANRATKVSVAPENCKLNSNKKRILATPMPNPQN